MALRRVAPSDALARPPRYGDIEDSDYVHDEIRDLATRARQLIIKMRNPDEEAMLEALRQYGPSEGAKRMMTLEKEAGDTAMATGEYVVFRHMASGKDCCRVGPSHRCFCNHELREHDARTKRCNVCGCGRYQYIPNRPEEIGEEYLARRANFDPSAWFAKCRCGHGHHVHDPNGSHGCRSCRCVAYDSHFGCVACDKHWEEHATIFETAQERVAAGRPVGQAFLPLADVNPEFAQIVFGGKHPQIKQARGTSRRMGTEHSPQDPIPISQRPTSETSPAPRPQTEMPGWGDRPPGPRLSVGPPGGRTVATNTKRRCKACAMIFTGTQCTRCGTRI